MTEQSATAPGFQWGRWLTLYSAATFLVLGGDAAMHHYHTVGEHPLAWIPIVFGPIAALACLPGILSARWRPVVTLWVGLAAMAVGGAGTLFHNLPTYLERGDQSIVAAFLDATNPPMAPAAFASAGILLVLVWWGERLWRTGYYHPKS